MNFHSFGQAQKRFLENWEYRESADQVWKPCVLPNSIYTILEHAGQLYKPYWTDHEKKLEWVDQKSWFFRCSFECTEDWIQDSAENLILEGIDSHAEILLNGAQIFFVNNAFRTWEIPCKEWLKTGSNILEIRFPSQSGESEKLYKLLPHPLPGEHRVCIRKPQFQFGWDFAPKFTGCAIRSLPYFKTHKELRLENFRLHTMAIADQMAELELRSEIYSDSAKRVRLDLGLEEHHFTFEIDLDSGLNYITEYLTLTNPKLWWPNGYGVSYLYDSKLEITDMETGIRSETITQKTGIRSIELIQEPDSIGRSFYFLVNAVPVYAKGANYVPADAIQVFHSRPQELMKALKDCHFNMIRIWGGGSYEQDGFYQACDSAGILVWQDFMYACAMYPGDIDFFNNASQEAAQQIKRLSKYACIALWCGNNENNEGWHRWGWQIGLSPRTKERIWGDYQKLFEDLLPHLVETLGNRCSYIGSSPLFGRGDDRFRTEGDAHDWGIWHDRMPFESFANRVPRFMSESGFQSYPSWYTISQYVPEESLILESKEILTHQKHHSGQSIINEYLKRDLPEPKDLKSFIYLNQLNQAEGMLLGIRAQRFSKPYCMGSLYWQLNDCWPGISWSGMDYYGGWKALMHYVKKGFSPVLCHIDLKDDVFYLNCVSDLPNPDSVRIIWEIFDTDFKKIFSWEGKHQIHFEQAVLIKQVDIKDLVNQPGKTQWLSSIRWKYGTSEEETLIHFNPLKQLKLKPYQLKFENFKEIHEGYQFTVSSDQIVKGLNFEEDASTHFYPNFVDLIPGSKKEIIIKTNRKDLTSENIRSVSLNDYISK